MATQEQLAAELERIRNRRQALAGTNPNSPVATRDYRDGASEFNSFAPQQMDTRLVESPFSEQISQIAGKTSTAATAASGVMAQNRFNFEQYQQALADLEKAKKNRVKPTKQTIKPPKLSNPAAMQATAQNPIKTDQYVSNQTTADENYGGNPPTTPGTSYYTQTPKWLDINAGLTTFQAGGHSWTLNASVAPRFKAFINALVATGYKIKTAGSYVNRNQANGSGNKSLHAYGLAIDINAFAAGNSYNPGGAGKHYTDMPKGVSALAAKYGLVWGGDWRNSKDYMHFSVPYNGLLRQQATKPPKPMPGKNQTVQDLI